MSGGMYQAEVTHSTCVSSAEDAIAETEDEMHALFQERKSACDDYNAVQTHGHSILMTTC